jgi:hypothetical protein
VHLRLNVAPGAGCHFALSWDGETYVTIGPIFLARSSRWVGAKVGLFASATNARPPAGAALFQDFRVRAPERTVIAPQANEPAGPSPPQSCKRAPSTESPHA